MLHGDGCCIAEQTESVYPPCDCSFYPEDINTWTHTHADTVNVVAHLTRGREQTITDWIQGVFTHLVCGVCVCVCVWRSQGGWGALYAAVTLQLSIQKPTELIPDSLESFVFLQCLDKDSKCRNTIILTLLNEKCQCCHLSCIRNPGVSKYTNIHKLIIKS